MKAANVKRLLEFQLKEAEAAGRTYHGALATARGEVGRIERLIRENDARANEIKKVLAEYKP